MSAQDYRDQGAADAELMIRRGSLALRAHGMPAAWFEKYMTMVKSRLGVEFEHFGCCVFEGDFETSDGFNEVMEREIAKRFGDDALSKLEEEAKMLSGYSEPLPTDTEPFLPEVPLRIHRVEP